MVIPHEGESLKLFVRQPVPWSLKKAEEPPHERTRLRRETI